MNIQSPSPNVSSPSPQTMALRSMPALGRTRRHPRSSWSGAGLGEHCNATGTSEALVSEKPLCAGL
jgi:hypothetical protein